MMEKRREKIDDSVRGYASEKRRSLVEHPEIEDLTAYRRGELGAAAVEEIRDHLTLCEECSDLLLDLASFAELEPPIEAYRLSERDVAEQKADLLERISAEKDSAEEDSAEEDSGGKVLSFTPRSPPPAAGEVRVIPGWYHAVAASFLAAAVGLGFWSVSLRQQIGTVAPEFNYRIIPLWPLDEDVFRGSEGPESSPVSPELGLMVQMLIDEEVVHREYRVVVYGADGGELWNRGGLVRVAGRPAVYVPVAFPPELWVPRALRIKLYGLADEGAELVAEYELNLLPVPPSA